MKCSRFASILMSLAVALAFSREAPAQTFHSDDPIQVDRDNLPVARPKKSRINDYYDFLENSFFPRGDRTKRRAPNINTLGEVPDSSWYTNRVSRAPLARDALTRGPDKGTGPAAGTWTIIAGKSQGISPGFSIRDASGDQYFLKFDPASNPEMATAAEVICTKFFHALGYNVPENYLVEFKSQDLRIESEA